MRRMKLKMRFCIYSALILFVMAFRLISEKVSAESDCKVASALVSEDSIYIYIRGVQTISADSLIQIGTSVCSSDNIATGSLDSLEIPMRTILLLDNSFSIPENRRPDIQNIMRRLIEQAVTGEQFKIGIFSDTVTYLCDYLSDTDSALSLVDEIVYQNQDTYFSDVLYSVLTEVKEKKEKYFTRIIMISDGADDQEIGYTNEEVRDLVNESNIPVYTIGTKKKKNQSELETMFSFSRAAGAEHYLLDENTSSEEIVSGLLADQETLCIRIRPDSELLDGSRKKIRMKLQTEKGEKELTVSVNMPFAAGTSQVVEEPEENSEEVDEMTKEADREQSGAGNELPVIGEKATEEIADIENTEKGNNGILIIVVSLVVLVAAGTIVFLMIKKKKQEMPNEKPESAQKREEVRRESEKEDRTLWFSAEQKEDKTIKLWNDESMMGKQQTYIMLRNLDNPVIMYKIPIESVVHIGRKNADINIDDKYVSTKHCDVILRSGLLYVKDTESANGTYYEGIRVTGEKPIVNGGTLRMGQSNYSVELVME